MPPPTHDLQGQLRYFIKLLAALCLQGGGDLAIDLKYLRQIDEDGSRQALVEETDCQNDTLVLRYGSKHSAMYPVEPECTESRSTHSTTTTPPQVPRHLPVNPNPRPMTMTPDTISHPVSAPRKPLTDADLARAERKIAQIRAAARIKREQERYPREESMEEILGPER